MALPTHEEISIGVTKRFVNKYDIDNFNSYLKSLNEHVIPIEDKAKDCNMSHVIEEGHIIETAIERLDTEIVRMIYWSKTDFKLETEKSAKSFNDIKNRYKKAKNFLQYDCICTKK